MFKTTDDCGVVLKYLPDESIYVVNGEQFNMKLTYKEDIFLLDKLFQLRSIRNQPTLLEKSEMEELQGKVVVVLGVRMVSDKIFVKFVGNIKRRCMYTVVLQEWMCRIVKV